MSYEQAMKHWGNHRKDKFYQPCSGPVHHEPQQKEGKNMLSKETALKILDAIDAIRREEDYKPMGGDSFECRKICADIAREAGFKDRAEWAAMLRNDPQTLFAKAMA